MNKEYLEMNECEKNHLIKRSKEMLQKEFDYISIDDYEIYNRYIKDKDILNALIMLLGANLEIKKIYPLHGPMLENNLEHYINKYC